MGFLAAAPMWSSRSQSVEVRAESKSETSERFAGTDSCSQSFPGVMCSFAQRLPKRVHDQSHTSSLVTFGTAVNQINGRPVAPGTRERISLRSHLNAGRTDLGTRRPSA